MLDQYCKTHFIFNSLTWQLPRLLIAEETQMPRVRIVTQIDESFVIHIDMTFN